MLSESTFAELERLGERIERENAKREVERGDTNRVSVELYVCPTEGCGNYFGAKEMGWLEEQFTGPKVEDKALLEAHSGSPHRHTRAECPDCRVAGRGRVMRVRVRVAALVPKEGPEPPALPPSMGTSKVSIA